MKKILPVLLLTTLLGGCIFLLQQRPQSTYQRYEELFAEYRTTMPQVDEKEEGLKKEFSNARMFFEYDRIRRVDLRTGEVPRDGLRKAHQEVLKMIDEVSAKSTNNALVWEERGPDNIGGRSRALMWDPNDLNQQAVFAGGVGGGLWYTSNIYNTNPNWVSVNPTYSNVAVTCIGADPTDPRIMYYGTGEGYRNADAQSGAGIWKSIDGGQTWTVLPFTETHPAFTFSQKIKVNSFGNVFAATKGGLWKSVDQGTTWTKVLGQGTGQGGDIITDIDFGADNDLYVSVDGSGVYKSDISNGTAQGDAGTFTHLNTNFSGGFGRIEVACAPSNASILYAAVEQGSTLDQIYRSINGGNTWTATNNEPDDDDWGIPANDMTRGQAWYDLCIEVNPTNANQVFTGGVDLFRSANRGDNWTQIAHWYGGFGYPYVHADQHNMAFKPGSGTDILFSNDGGIYLSQNAGNTFADKNKGYNVTQFYAMSIDQRPNNPIIIGGTQDNGTIKISNNGIGAGDQISGGDGAYCDIDPIHPDTLYTTSQYASTRRSKDGGNNFQGITNPNLNSSNTQFINPLELDRRNGSVLYQSSHELWRLNSPHTTNGWLKATRVISSSGFSAMTTAWSTPNLLYVAAAGRVYRIPNANQGNFLTDPEAVNPGGTTGGNISCIALDPNDDDHIVITYTNYGLISHVLECQDASLGPNAVWKDLQGNLPDLPVNAVIFEPNNPNGGLIIGTDLGAFRCADINVPETDIYWSPERTGLGLPRVNALEARYNDNSVHAATHGRGFFSSYTFANSPVADFGVVTDTVCDGYVQFIDSTANVPTAWAWDFGDGTTSTRQSPAHQYANSGTYTVSMVVSNANGIDSITQSINIVVVPGIQFGVSADTVYACVGDTVALIASGANTYTWYPSAGLDTDQGDSVNAVITTSRNYTIEGVGNFGCEASNMIHIEVRPTPPIWAGQDQTITQIGDSVQLDADGGVTYQWSPTTGLSCTTCEDPMVSVDSTTTYTLTGYSADGCSRTDQVTVRVNIVGREELLDPGVIGLTNFPNPFNNATQIQYQLPNAAEVDLEIVNLRGQKIADLFSGTKAAGTHRISWQPAGLSQGIYYLRLQVEGQLFTRKLVYLKK